MSAPLRQEWFSAAELAGLPGMPSSARHVREHAREHDWETREAPGRGTALKLYSVDSLPPEARAEIERRAAEQEAILAHRLGVAEGAEAEHYRQIRAEELRRATEMPPHAQRRAEVRAAILRARDAFRAACRIGSKQAANEAFAAAFAAGKIPIDLRGLKIERLSARTLWRWERQAEVDGWRGLGGGYGARAGSSVIDEHPEWVGLILGTLAERPHVRVRRVYELLCARHGAGGLVSERTLAAWIERWRARNPGIWADLTNPDAARGRFMPAQGSRSEDIVRLNQLWELDSSPVDLFLADGRRYTLIAAIDVFSRRCRMVVAPSSTAREVGQVLRRAILDLGVPEAVLTDNGRDYVSNYSATLLRSMGIEHRLAPPYRGDHKPHVERLFRTLQHDLSEMLPGYCGHSVAEAQAIRSRRTFAARLGESDREAFQTTLDLAGFVELLQRWILDYESQPHSGLDGQSPRQVAEAWTGEVRRIEDERALDVLLQPMARPNTVHKRGLRIDKAWFCAGELGPLVGQLVQVRRDPSDVGRVWVFDGDGRFVCTAICPARTGVSRAEIAARATALYREALKEGRAALREAKKAADTSQMAEEILAERLRQRANVVPLRPAEEATTVHTTPELRGAEEFVAAQASPRTPREPLPEAIAEGREVIRRFDAERERQREIAERQRAEVDAAIRRWIDLAERDRESLSERDRVWLDRMAARNPDIRDHVKRFRPDLTPLLTRAEEALA